LKSNILLNLLLMYCLLKYWYEIFIYQCSGAY
jgi:hypothetical protein